MDGGHASRCGRDDATKLSSRLQIASAHHHTVRAIDQRAGLPPAEALGVLTRWRPDADGNVRDPTPVGGVLCSKDPGDTALPTVCGPRTELK